MNINENVQIGFRTQDGCVRIFVGTCWSCDQFGYLAYTNYCDVCV
jgi:hypothetical protein